MELRIVLGLLGIFAMVSGWLKSRARVREYMGGPGLGVVELGAGFILLIIQGPDMAGPGTRVAVGWATGVVMILSNARAVLRARGVSRDLSESEGRRLYTRVKFEQALREAAMEDPDENDPPPASGEPPGREANPGAP